MIWLKSFRENLRGLPLRKLKIGIVTTGNEVFYKRIEDKSGANIVSYGEPTLSGTMFLLSYIGNIHGELLTALCNAPDPKDGQGNSNCLPKGIRNKQFL